MLTCQFSLFVLKLLGFTVIMHWIFLFYATIHFLSLTSSANNMAVCKSKTATDDEAQQKASTIFLEEIFSKQAQKGEKGLKGENGTMGNPGEKGAKGETGKVNETEITETYSLVQG